MRPVNFDRLAEQLRNWGRWGEADQRGTLNHIGPETLKKAAAEVQSGKLFNLGLRFDAKQIVGGNRSFIGDSALKGSVGLSLRF